MTEYFWMMTILFKENGRDVTRSLDGSATAGPGDTRQSLYTAIREKVVDGISGDVVTTFFSLEPNRLGAL